MRRLRIDDCETRLELFGDVFDNEPARRHFAEYLTGLMVAERRQCHQSPIRRQEMPRESGGRAEQNNRKPLAKTFDFQRIGQHGSGIGQPVGHKLDCHEYHTHAQGKYRNAPASD